MILRTEVKVVENKDKETYLRITDFEAESILSISKYKEDDTFLMALSADGISLTSFGLLRDIDVSEVAYFDDIKLQIVNASVFDENNRYIGNLTIARLTKDAAKTIVDYIENRSSDAERI